MPDWRWVTQVKYNPHPSNVLAPTEQGQWINFDNVDSITPLPEGRVHGARTRLGWLRDHGWHYLFCVEIIEVAGSSGPDEPQPTTRKG